MPNIKISDLNRANRLSDDALLIVVQDGGNKTVTVKELGEKINHEQNKLIAHLRDEEEKSSQSGNFQKLKQTVARHEYELDRQKETIKGLQIKLGDVSRKAQHTEDRVKYYDLVIRKCEADNILTRKGITYTNNRVDELTIDVHNLDKKTTYLTEYISKLDEDSKQALAYITPYIHRSPDDYWG